MLDEGQSESLPGRSWSASGEYPMDKMDELRAALHGYGQVAVALSGGVDSTFLLNSALETLGPNCVLALTITSRVLPTRELEAAKATLASTEVRHILLEEDVANIPGFADNPPDRCYHCKRYLFIKVIAMAKEAGFTTILDGTNADDLHDYRPGLQALQELGVKSPLAELGFTKAEIRKQSRSMGIPGWDRPSLACLATRFPLGEAVTAQALARVDEAEEALRALGFSQVRVRCHGDLARIELLQDELGRLWEAALRTQWHAIGPPH